MSNAVFIDTSNLNALFKVDGKFVLGVNYASCPDKIATDAQALGTSFDVYLSMWPRQRGESDDIINALSIGGVPFVVVKEEVEAVLKLMEKVPGVGTIYLCNALANFVIQARVSNFQSAINYGSRVALVSVKNKMLEALKVYDNPAQLYEEQGESFSCYGDLDLIDTDAIKAQYEELTPFNRGVLVPLAHLVTSYRSPYNVEAEEVKKELRLGEYAYQPLPAETPPPPSPPKVLPKYEPAKPVFDIGEDEERIQYKKPGVSFLNVVLVLAILAGFAVSGLGYAFQRVVPQITQLHAEIVPFQDETKHYDELSKVYLSCKDMAGDASELVSFVQANTLGFTFAGLEVNGESIVLRCNTSEADAIDGFREYLETRYTVGGVNNLDTTQGANATVIYNYNVVIVRP